MRVADGVQHEMSWHLFWQPFCWHGLCFKYILRHCLHTINGEVVLLPRGRPSLIPKAVPTLHPPTENKKKRKKILSSWKPTCTYKRNLLQSREHGEPACGATDSDSGPNHHRSPLCESCHRGTAHTYRTEIHHKILKYFQASALDKEHLDHFVHDLSCVRPAWSCACLKNSCNTALYMFQSSAHV